MSLTWDEFVTAHAAVVLAAALRVLGSQADADDVAQDVFMEIFQAGNFSQLYSQPALVRTMATRRAIDRLRRYKTTVSLEGSEYRAREFEPGEYAIAAELDERLRDAVRHLPAREAEVFCMFYFDDCPQSEIAQLLNISKGAVTKSLCSARNRLSQAFSNLDPETHR